MVRHATAHKHLQKKKQKTPFDILVYIFMVVTPLFEVPQAIAIYSARSAENVSVITWLFFFLSGIVWAVYALRNRLYPLVFMYCLYIITDGFIMAGIILYS